MQKNKKLSTYSGVIYIGVITTLLILIYLYFAYLYKLSPSNIIDTLMIMIFTTATIIMPLIIYSISNQKKVAQTYFHLIMIIGNELDRNYTVLKQVQKEINNFPINIDENKSVLDTSIGKIQQLNLACGEIINTMKDNYYINLMGSGLIIESIEI
ncbi:MAG: hypothetical protein ACYDAS_01310 [Patescibacteria group bacterium]